MSYYEVTLRMPLESRDAIMCKLGDMGSTGFLEKGTEVVAYFPVRRTIDELSTELSGFRNVLESAGLDPGFSFNFALLPKKDWNETWKEGFSPIDVGEKLTIIPSWLKKETDRIPIILDPGMVFGTGYHETTRTCLALIEKLSGEPWGSRFLDIGTGTGILAIAAAKLGFEVAMAVDIDEVAIDAAVRNVEANRLGNVIIKNGDVRGVEGTFDFIAANLLSEILIEISAEIESRLNPGGIVLLSGMLIGQEEAVINAFEKTGLTFKEKEVSNNWVTVVFIK